MFKIRLPFPLKNIYRVNGSVEKLKEKFDLKHNSGENLVFAKSRIVDDVEKVKATFYRKGFEEGKRKAESSVLALKEMFKEAIEKLKIEKQNFIEESEKELVEMALAIAKKIIRREVSVDREIVKKIAREALRRVMNSPTRKIIVRINPRDWEALTEMDKDFLLSELSESEVIIEKDESIQSGGCIVETEGQMINASIENQIEEISRALMEEGE